MIKNFFRIALRNFYRQKFFSLINIIGLSVGLTASLFILLYIIDEYSYDTFHKNAKSIYCINLYGRMGNQEFNSCYTSAEAASKNPAEIIQYE